MKHRVIDLVGDLQIEHMGHSLAQRPRKGDTCIYAKNGKCTMRTVHHLCKWRDVDRNCLLRSE